jgi:hypothetical protein
MTVNRLLVGTLIAAVLTASAVTSAQTGPVPKFFGPVDQDGCGFCCEFICQRTPTPVPEFDGQGRRAFRRSQGSFMLTAEAGIGRSNRLPGIEGVFSGGAVQPITDISGRPSVQVLPSITSATAAPRSIAARIRSAASGPSRQDDLPRGRCHHHLGGHGVSVRGRDRVERRLHARPLRQLRVHQRGHLAAILLSGFADVGAARR